MKIMVGRPMQGYRLSPQQSHLWSLQRDALNYTAQCAVMLDGEVRPERLREALQRVMDRHEILRTRFEPQSGFKLPLQVIDHGSELIWRDVEAPCLSENEQRAKIDEVFELDGRQRFNFQGGKLLRATLIKFSSTTHALIISLPSLCADAVSLMNLVQEIARYYAAAPDEEVFDEPTQYVQFSEWQNELLDSDNAEAGKEFWRQQDLNSLPPLTVPFERKPAVDATYQRASLTLPLDSDLAAEINVIAERINIAVGLVYLACWQILLWRLTGKPDAVIVSTLYAGRKYEELSDALGLFARSLPVRCNFTSQLKLDQVLKQLEHTIEEIDDWQDYFFPSGVAQPFAFEFHTLSPDTISANVRFQLLRIWTCADRSPLRLTCTQSGTSVHLEFNFDSQRHHPEQMQSLARAYRRLLQSVGSDQTITALEIVDEREEQQLRRWNDTKTEFAGSGWLHQMFEEQAARTPEAVALVFGSDSLTYRELNERANQLAHHLGALGVGPESVVGLLLERSFEMVVSILAVLKAGGAYLPLDPTYPAQRLSFMLSDAQPLVLLTQAGLNRLVHVPEGMAVVVVDEAAETLAQTATDNPEVEVKGDNLAYVIYTSGSTGMPKGVMVTHRGLSNYLSWSSRAYGLTAARGVPLHSSLSFDLSITALFNPLITGGWVHLLAEERGVEPLSTALLGGKQDYSLVKITPAHLAAVRQTASESGAAVGTRCFVIGGEALSWEEVRYWREQGAARQLVNEYGPTETVVGCCVYEVGEEAESTAEQVGGVPIGRPVANMQMYVLDEGMRCVPVGVSGELYIGGVGLARGYRGRAELTAERFVPHPYSEDAGARLYRTGDRGKYRPDGRLEYEGRRDEQVKVRGYRIELGEIEAALREHEAVSEAVVVVQEDENGHKRLVGYLIGRGGPEASGGELRRHLGERLPEYMVPGHQVWLKQWPLTSNGKVDRRALALMRDAEREQRYVAARTPIEEELTGIWEEVLGVKTVGVHDNFFELGGDSIVSLQIIAKAGKAGLLLLPQHIFQYPTVAGLASVATVDAMTSPVSVNVELEYKDFDKLLEKVEFEV